MGLDYSYFRWRKIDTLKLHGLIQAPLVWCKDEFGGKWNLSFDVCWYGIQTHSNVVNLYLLNWFEHVVIYLLFTYVGCISVYARSFIAIFCRIILDCVISIFIALLWCMYIYIHIVSIYIQQYYTLSYDCIRHIYIQWPFPCLFPLPGSHCQSRAPFGARCYNVDEMILRWDWKREGVLVLTLGIQSPCQMKIGVYTPWKFNIGPGNRQSQKETHLPTIIFRGYV